MKIFEKLKLNRQEKFSINHPVHKSDSRHNSLDRNIGKANQKAEKEDATGYEDESDSEPKYLELVIKYPIKNYQNIVKSSARLPLC